MRKAGLKKARENLVNLPKVYLLSMIICDFDTDHFLINSFPFLFRFKFNRRKKKLPKTKETVYSFFASITVRIWRSSKLGRLWPHPLTDETRQAAKVHGKAPHPGTLERPPRVC